MIIPGWWVWMKMDYFTNGSVPLFTGSEMTERHTYCDIDFERRRVIQLRNCGLCEHASSSQFSIRANNVSFQTAIVKVLHVPCSVHEPLARGSVK